jgi:plasmid stabilization system protein ParE
MAVTFSLTPRAFSDLNGIWEYIARENVAAADRVETALFHAFQKIALFPQMGLTRKELTALPVKFWSVPRFSNYIVVYRPDCDPVQIVAVVHGRRNLDLLLRKLRIQDSR